MRRMETGCAGPDGRAAARLLEDCGVTKAELIERFGSPVAELVDGLTKLDKLQFNTREENQAESFRKMLLAMARDVRVI
jgi:guanosine-3',5'-bis(diphosphate) 3'-pyrophosphohydrolase